MCPLYIMFCSPGKGSACATNCLHGVAYICDSVEVRGLEYAICKFMSAISYKRNMS